MKFVFQISPTNRVLTEIVEANVPFDAATGGYTLTATQVDDLAKQVVAKLGTGNITLTPDTALMTKRIEVQLPTPVGGPIPPVIPTTNQLTINFEIILASLGPADSKALFARQATIPRMSPAQSFDAMARRVAMSPKDRDELAELPPLPGAAEAEAQVEPVPPAPLPQIPGVPVPVTLPDPPILPNPAALTGISIPVNGGSFQVPGIGGNVQLPGTGGILNLPGTVRVRIPGTTQDVEVPGTMALPMNGATPAAAVPGPLIIAPRQPAINVSVPVTNIARQHKQGGLFHRNQGPISPQNPTRPPLTERLLNRP